MELTNTYVQNQSVPQEEYFAYREQQAKKFMELIKKGLGKNMTHKELVHIEFGFKKGMDTVTQNGRLFSRETLQSQ